MPLNLLLMPCCDHVNIWHPEMGVPLPPFPHHSSKLLPLPCRILLFLVLLVAVFSVYLPPCVFKFCACFFACSLLLQILAECFGSSSVY